MPKMDNLNTRRTTTSIRIKNVPIQLTHHGEEVDKKRTESIHNTICIGVPIIRKSLVCQIWKEQFSENAAGWMERGRRYRISLPYIHQDHRLTSWFCTTKCEIVRNIVTFTKCKIRHYSHLRVPEGWHKTGRCAKHQGIAHKDPISSSLFRGI